jgi:hypothetical protein
MEAAKMILGEVNFDVVALARELKSLGPWAIGGVTALAGWWIACRYKLPWIVKKE